MIYTPHSPEYDKLLDEKKTLLVFNKEGDVMGICLLLDTERGVAYRYKGYTSGSEKFDFGVERVDDVSWEIVDDDAVPTRLMTSPGRSWTTTRFRRG